MQPIISSTLPAILTANTYFWKPASCASLRRRNEARNLTAVAEYFSAIGMEVEQNSASVVGRLGSVEACFSYSESCANVYKSLRVTREGRNSNVTTLRKIAAASASS